MTEEPTAPDAGNDAPAEAPAAGSSGLSTTGPELGPLAVNLTGEAQKAANELIDALQNFANHAFDAGEAGVKDVLHIFDIANSELTKIFSTARGIVDKKL